MARIRYSLSQAQSIDFMDAGEKELRAAYTAMRDVMMKRINRLASGTEAQQRYVQPFLRGSRPIVELGQITNIRDLRYKVRELQMYTANERLSISGWKRITKRTVSSLQKAGFTNITEKNIDKFGKYMEKMRSAFGRRIFPSDEIAEAFQEAADESGKVDERELLSILEDLGAVIEDDGVDLFAW